MKFCVLKNSGTVIDGGGNPDETMFQNVINAGYLAEDAEILTEEEYKIRKLAYPDVPVLSDSELEMNQLKNRVKLAEDNAIALMDTIMMMGF